MSKIWIKRLSDKYGMIKSDEMSGTKYSDLISHIVQHNNGNISRAITRQSKDKWNKALSKISTEEKRFIMPDLSDVFPKRAPHILKSAESGKLISQTLRDNLTANLRESLNQFTPTTGEQTYIKRRGKNAGQINPKVIEDFKSRITDTFTNYTKKDPKIGIPKNIQAIATTEIRTTVNTTKKIYTDALREKNPELKLRKKWIHHSSLSDTPRKGHLQLDGKTIDYDDTFTVVQYKKHGNKWIKIGTVQMEHPHDNNGGAEEVINCNCDWEVLARRGIPEYKNVSQVIQKSLSIVEKALPIGHISHRKDGDYKKVGEGEWVKVSENGDGKTGNETSESKPEKKEYKPYSVKGFTVDKETIDKAVKEANGHEIKGRHWGSADSKNVYAKMVAFSSAEEFRPIDKISTGNFGASKFKLKEDEIKEAVKMRNYAQNRIKEVDRNEHPEVYRGMSVTKEQLESLISGKEKNIELTGSTAFTFKKEVMEQYSNSEWTQKFGSDKIGIKIILERNDNVDNSFGMWHDDKSDKTKPAFELLSGLKSVKVKNIDKIDDEWKNNKIQELSKQYTGEAHEWGEMYKKIGERNFKNITNLVSIYENGVFSAINVTDEKISDYEKRLNNPNEKYYIQSNLDILNNYKQTKEILEKYKNLFEEYGKLGTWKERDSYEKEKFGMVNKIQEYQKMSNSYRMYCEAI
jgi:hypothetical protein